METEQKWTVIAVVVSIILFVALGYILGYVLTDKSCTLNPLVYGIVEINELNEDYYRCNCASSKGFRNSFTFTEEGIKQNSNS